MSYLPKKWSLPPRRKNLLVEHIVEVLRHRMEVSFAFLHGSFMDEGDFADIDLAVYLREKPSPSVVFYEIKLEMELEEVLGYPVDVRILNTAPLSFQYEACRYGVPIFERDMGERVDYQTLTWKKYFDFAPFRRYYLREVLNLEI